MFDAEKIQAQMENEHRIAIERLCEAAEIAKVIEPLIGDKWEIVYYHASWFLCIKWRAEGTRAAVEDMRFVGSVITTKWPQSRRVVWASRKNTQEIEFTNAWSLQKNDGETSPISVVVSASNVVGCEVQSQIVIREQRQETIQVGASCIGFKDLDTPPENKEPS